MAESLNPIFNNIIKQIIKKSLFTERQIEIILNQLNLQKIDFAITKGAYYRQVIQSRDKLLGLFYSIILLRGLGVVIPDDLDVISRLSDQVSVIQNSDVFPEKENEIMSVIDTLVKRACRL
ncbi:MAG: hypothetical protein ACT4N5_07965 [Nitrosopumilaceae archaeon]